MSNHIQEHRLNFTMHGQWLTVVQLEAYDPKATAELVEASTRLAALLAAQSVVHGG